MGLVGTARAEHRATFLGNPATRFADPLVAPADLRWRFRDPQLRQDIAEVLRQFGWKGRLEDLFQAAETAEIVAVDIPVGTRLPFMSTRRKGRPICLKDVVWAGDAPAPAFAFNFNSLGRRYRCLTPQACSNFLVEDLGVEPRPALALECLAPAELLPGRPVRVCLRLRNTGDGEDRKVVARLPVPANAVLAEATEGGTFRDGAVDWDLGLVKAGATREVCASFTVDRLGELAFAPAARGEVAPGVSSDCRTTVRGVPAILLEVVDAEDPIQVGNLVEYEIRVLNQGTAAEANVRVRCELPESQEFVSATGTASVKAEGRVLMMETLSSLEPKAEARWRVVVKAAREDDARFRVELSSDEFQLPINENESTRQY
ncbi:MAG: hypothetical protein ACKOET_15885 [Verrucomicrobiota bacterium]